MQTALRMETTVLPGHRVEVIAPDIPEGTQVQVIIVLPPPAATAQTSMVDLVQALPPAPLLFKAPRDVNRFLREEREAWER